MSASPAVFSLLRLLADGRIQSGQALAAGLGVSRVAVRHGIHAIERMGLRVLGVRGQGYCLAEPVDLLDGERLAELLRGAFRVELIDECHSTNGVLMDRARLGGPEALVLACERQTAGRGRRGKRWESGIGTDLTFSVLWRFDRGAGALSGLSLAVGVALVRALARRGYRSVQLKWPNDLMLDGSKFGGILIETTGDHRGPSSVVIGVGLNVRWNAERAAAVDQPATGLAAAEIAVPSRTELLASLLVELRSALEQFGSDGFAPFRAEWLRHHAWQGRRVTLRVAEGAVANGEAVGVSENGALLLRQARGVEQFHSGELRLADG